MDGHPLASASGHVSHGRTTQPDQVHSACAAAGFRRNRRCGRAAPRPRPRHRCRRQGTQLRFEESPPVVRLAEVAPSVEHLQAAVALQGEGRRPAAPRRFISRRLSAKCARSARRSRASNASAEAPRQAPVRHPARAAPDARRCAGNLDVVWGTLDPRQHRRAEAVGRFGGKSTAAVGGPRVEYRAGVAQQAVSSPAERLAGQLGDPQVMGHRSGAGRRRRLAVGIGHHAAAMQAYVRPVTSQRRRAAARRRITRPRAGHQR